MGESVALGEALPDHFDPLAAFVGSHISQLGDIAGHLEEYAAIEREYAGKVQALVRRTRAARDRRIAELCVGPSPTRSWNAADPSNKSTAQTFLTAVLDSQEATATAHDALAEALGSVVADLSRTQTQDDAVLKAVRPHLACRGSATDQSSTWILRASCAQAATRSSMSACAPNPSTRRQPRWSRRSATALRSARPAAGRLTKRKRARLPLSRT